MSTSIPSPPTISGKALFIQQYQQVRQQTENLCAPLEPEDYVPQPVTDVSPPKWHLAHTTWFFETFLLKTFEKDFKPHHPKYGYLFNSYYQYEGDRWQRMGRGHLSRPTVKDVYAYRQAVDERMARLMESADESVWPEIQHITLLGLNHEQQHQELLLYDLKYILCHNPLWPVYNQPETNSPQQPLPQDYFEFIQFGEKLIQAGYQGDGFAYDNEMPVQKVFTHSFGLRKGLVTNREYLEFMEAGGYGSFQYWLDDGWNWLQSTKTDAPMYWHSIDGRWMEMTLNGLQVVNPDAPVTHISFYEAWAFASWKEMRLPTEFEWERAAQTLPNTLDGVNLQEAKFFHPCPAITGDSRFYQLLGDVWEWTNSNYLPYHGYQPADGALGEYNGKFMANQMVMRGGSCATPASHLRITYRNFFHPDKRWMFGGIRLAR